MIDWLFILPRWCSTAEPHQHSAVFERFLRWNFVVKKCCFCFTKAVHYRLCYISIFSFWVKFCCFLSGKICHFLSYQFAQHKYWILLCPLKPFKTLAFLLVFFLLLSKYRSLDATWQLCPIYQMTPST